MTTKKSTTTTRAVPGESGLQGDFDAIYTAHQVHTLAQITFGQLTGSCFAGFAGVAPPVSGPVAYGSPTLGIGGGVPLPQSPIYWRS